jgi:hypothetical protein
VTTLVTATGRRIGLPGAVVCLQLLTASGCGGSSTPAATPVAPPAPSGLNALLVPALGVNAALLSWAPVSSAAGYLVEVGTTTGASDFASIQASPSPSSHTVGGLLVGRSYFARVRAMNQAGSSTASNEVRIESVDLRDIIDALYFGNGPLIPRDGLRYCVSGSGRWITYPAGVTVRLIISASAVSAAAQQAVQRAAEQWIASTLGSNSVIVQLTGDPDPRPGNNEVTITLHSDPVSQGCSFDRGCTILTLRANVLVAARALIGPSLASSSAAFAHDAVGHGGLGMCHIDGGLIGGARNTLMGGGPNVFSCPSPSDVCIADGLTPLDAAAAAAVYASGLPRGAERSLFLAAGLVTQSGGAPVTAEAAGVRRARVGPDTELVILDHR